MGKIKEWCQSTVYRFFVSQRVRRIAMAKVTISENVCKGCGLCTTVCPKKIDVLAHDILNAKGYHPAKVSDMSLCIGCAMCATMCPDCAIKVER